MTETDPRGAPRIDQHLSLRTAATHLHAEFDGVFGAETIERFLHTDVVITMGCGDACPVIPGKRYLDWELDDPAGTSVEDVRPVRDEIERRVRSLLNDLGVPVHA